MATNGLASYSLSSQQLTCIAEAKDRDEDERKRRAKADEDERTREDTTALLARSLTPFPSLSLSRHLSSLLGSSQEQIAHLAEIMG